MRAFVLVLLAALLFGASTPASKLLLGEIHPVELAGWLYLGAAVGVLPMLRRGGRALPARADSRNWSRLAGAVLFGGVLGPITLLLGLKVASAASVSLWLNLELAATAVLGVLVFRDHLGRWSRVAVAGVIAAGALLSFERDSGGIVAALLVGLACCFWGMDNHLTALIDGLSPARTTFWKGLAAGAFNLVAARVLGASWPGTGSVLGAVAVGIFAYGVSITFYISAAQSMGATRAQMVFAASPFLGAGLSWAVLGEPIGVLHLLAGALLVGSLALLFGDRHEHLHEHEAVEHDHAHRHDDGHHDHVHPGLPPADRHAHPHRHEPAVHGHPHWPDLHHRHGHGVEGESGPSSGSNTKAKRTMTAKTRGPAGSGPAARMTGTGEAARAGARSRSRPAQDPWRS